MSEQDAQTPSFKQRAREELRSYLIVSAYLFVCFAVIMLYEDSLRSSDVALTTLFTSAVVKALVIGKFVLIGEMLGAGERVSAPTLKNRIVARTLGLSLVLFLLKLVEEAILGLIKGPGLLEAIVEYLDQPLLVWIAPVLLMLLILVPMVAAAELSKALGYDRFQELLQGRSGDPG